MYVSAITEICYNFNLHMLKLESLHVASLYLVSLYVGCAYGLLRFRRNKVLVIKRSCFDLLESFATNAKMSRHLVKNIQWFHPNVI